MQYMAWGEVLVHQLQHLLGHVCGNIQTKGGVEPCHSSASVFPLPRLSCRHHRLPVGKLVCIPTSVKLSLVVRYCLQEYFFIAQVLYQSALNPCWYIFDNLGRMVTLAVDISRPVSWFSVWLKSTFFQIQSDVQKIYPLEIYKNGYSKTILTKHFYNLDMVFNIFY